MIADLCGAITLYAGKKANMDVRAEDIYDKFFVPEAFSKNIIRTTCEVVALLGSKICLHVTTDINIFIARVRPPETFLK